MKWLVRIHHYLSCFVAPAMLFFAVSGAWQAFRFHESRKDGSYTAPAVLKSLSHVHMAERLSGPAAEWFRLGQVVLAAAFALTAILGIVMALKLKRSTWFAWTCLLAGAVLPVLLVVAARR